MKILLSLVLILANIAMADEGEQRIVKAQKEYKELLRKEYILMPHKGTYLFPTVYNFNPNQKSYKSFTDDPKYKNRGDFNNNLEAEFQVSFLVLLENDFFGKNYDLFLGYTHQAWWQLYNDDWSRPFRETNYSPEIFFRKMYDQKKILLKGRVVSYDFGMIHQSNGQMQELSRSWNRVFARLVLQYDQLLIKTAIWYRLPEKKEKDDNPHIYDYLGFGELEFDYFWKKDRIELKLIPGIHHQGIEIGYSQPMHEGLRFYTRIGYGYGLSLIDQENESQTIGIGVSMEDYISSSN